MVLSTEYCWDQTPAQHLCHKPIPRSTEGRAPALAVPMSFQISRIIPHGPFSGFCPHLDGSISGTFFWEEISLLSSNFFMCYQNFLVL